MEKEKLCSMRWRGYLVIPLSTDNVKEAFRHAKVTVYVLYHEDNYRETKARRSTNGLYRDHER